MFFVATRRTLGAMTRMRCVTKIAGVVVAATGLMASLAPPVRAEEPRTEDVVGGWVAELPCLVTSAAPALSTPTTVPLSCASGTTWDGSWTGHTFYRLSGTLDLVTGDFHGDVDEMLVGFVTVTRAAGTLHLVGTLDVDGASNTVVVGERIVGGTGAFGRSSGTVIFEGLALGTVGQGGYHGAWMHP
jgi:hypothetical protein